MVIGVLRLEIQIPANRSLKGKRAALRPLIATLAREFSASVAEVGEQDSWQSAEIGVCVVSGDRRHANGVLSRIHDRAAGWSGEAILGRSSMELIEVGEG
jgi:uncharacterized protein YlxP (DUF503 family)